jgi:radical SAM protein with 4Fe4S-binding SPASM domain
VLPHPARAASRRLVPDPELDLAARVRELREQFGKRLAIRMGSAEETGGAAFSGERPVCDVGVRELHVLPDGRATRCRYLPGRDELAVGSLNEQSILDIWNGPRLGALVDPSRAVYAGTACASCAGFAACNRRGRCYVSALEGGGRLHAPDAFCRLGGKL